MDTSSMAQRLTDNTAVVFGKLLEGVFATVARVRPAAKPLHPRGTLHVASIERVGMAARVGVPWIDQPGSSVGLARVSRATGLPASLPDIHGLALRLPSDVGGDADLLFATTGLGRVTRFILMPVRRAGRPAYSTLLPYRTASGAVTLAAVPADPDGSAFILKCAPVGGAWETFARMELTATGSQELVSFDPVLNQLPGLDYYQWAADLREGAYRAARRSRSDS